MPRVVLLIRFWHPQLASGNERMIALANSQAAIEQGKMLRVMPPLRFPSQTTEKLEEMLQGRFFWINGHMVLMNLWPAWNIHIAPNAKVWHLYDLPPRERKNTTAFGRNAQSVSLFQDPPKKQQLSHSNNSPKLHPSR